MIDIFSRAALREGPALVSPELAEEGFPALKRARGMSADELVRIIECSGLAGKRGAGFPTYPEIQFLRRPGPGHR